MRILDDPSKKSAKYTSDKASSAEMVEVDYSDEIVKIDKILAKVHRVRGVTGSTVIDRKSVV